MTLRTFCAAFGVVSLSLAAAPLSAQNTPAPPLEFYGDLPAIEEGEISPSGAHTALLMTVQGERRILIFDATGAPVKQFLAGDAKVRAIEWIGDEAILLLRAETELTPPNWTNRKVEWQRANIIPLDDRREVISVFADQRYVANAVLGFHGIRQVGNDWKGYFGGLRKGDRSGRKDRILDGRPALFEVDLRTGAVDMIAFPPSPGLYTQYGLIRDWTVGMDGQVAATLNINIETGKWSIRGASDAKIAEGVEPSARVDLKGLNSDGTSAVYSIFDEDSSETRYFFVPLDGGEATELWRGININQFIHRPASSHIEGVLTTSNRAVLSNPDKQAGTERVLNTFPQHRMRLADWTSDLSTFVARTSGNYDSGTWYRIDAATGGRMMMGLERAGIQGPAIGKVRSFSYTAQDGLEIDAVLTLPAGKQPENLPVVLLPHGGPSAHDNVEFDWWAQAYASRGYAVLQPNFRGSTNRDDAFREAGNGEWGRKMQTDISDGLTALAAEGIGDPDRACIVGASYGGYAALAGVTLQQGIYRCAVSVNGVADMDDFFASSLPGRYNVFSRSLEDLLGADPDLKALSPRHHASNADAPILLIHGRDDTTVSYRQSVLMEDALEDAGKPATLVTLDGEDHQLSRADTRKQMLERAVAFVELHNPAD